VFRWIPCAPEAIDCFEMATTNARPLNETGWAWSLDAGSGRRGEVEDACPCKQLSLQRVRHGAAAFRAGRFLCPRPLRLVRRDGRSG
jgi:hypothetical protein